MNVVKVNTEGPTWIPSSLRREVLKNGRMELVCRMHPAIRRVLRKKKRIKLSDWCERHRVVTMSSLPGPWRNETTPYLKDIMDASIFPSVTKIILCKAPQVGGSEIGHNFVGYCIDHAPGPVMYVFPDEQTAKENSRDRVIPMLQNSPQLSKYLTALEDDLSVVRVNLQHMPIYFSWATSASRLANKPIRYVIFDEVDKYPEFTGKKEADPISLGEKRTKTFSHNRKMWVISTPTVETGPIWKAFNDEAEVRFDWHVRCPKCGELQLMEFDRIKWPKDERDPERIESKRLAWYQCKYQECDSTWDDTQRNQAVRSGEWRAREEDIGLWDFMEQKRPAKIAFHIPSWLSSFVSLSEVSASFLRGKDDKGKLKDFMNAHKAEPWVIYTQERTVDRVKKLKDDRPEHLVPSGRKIAALTAGIDTQDDGFWFEVRAWAYGQTLESYQIDSGFVTSFGALDEILFRAPYKSAEGYEYHVRIALIDSGGHRTSEVYDWARRHRGRVLPLKGMQRMNRPYRYSQIDTYPGTNKPISGGVKLLLIDTNYYKDMLSTQLEINPGDPGAWHFNADTTDAWCEQMTVEYVNDKGVWECPQHKANHAWDCSVYALASADVCHVKRMVPPEKRVRRPERRKEESSRRVRRW